MILLEITIPNGVLIGLGVLAVIAILSYIGEMNRLRKQNREQKAEYLRVENDLKLNVNKLAAEQFEIFKAKELEGQTRIITANAIEAARNMLDRWKILEGKSMREDAVKRSMAINLGKITEHLIPFSEQFNSRNFNPQDARFIGSPVDLILFDGASPNKEKDKVTVFFIEVKTGKSALNETQKRVKEAVISRRVEWLELTKGEFSWQTEG